ncbi:glycoside hydrolase family 3 N-terminal domain-containing protein [Deinococcus alpinitundrae]|uniref:glycoside hydrolase family 3 N-terminal domain-containing protein n=1 Tax=Deinococcus alpinitundrae TaxID=468913 RepID=UPI001379538A|nr:glycoside hydrolase family 3 N-terminal domain-containing protein [Deinococcus alpinitundrae]
MSLPAARTLIIDLPGPDLSAEQGRFLAQYGFGGVCLFARNFSAPDRTARLVRDIRDALGHDALIATDQEGGAVLRRLDVPMAPTPQALGVIGSADAARQAGAVAARGLIELGLNWNFAPTLDVNINPLNPVIGERAFGTDPGEVARLGVAWALGSEAAGVMSSVKHFPGHGDTALDSHLALPTVDKPLAELERTEWLPFRAAVQAGVGSIMTAHIVYPALDPHEPATLSHRVLTGLLRDDWGYGGIIVTDATDMQAIAAAHPHGEAAPLALAAGADAVLSCGHGDLTTHAEHAQAIERALASGRLAPERLHEAQARLSAAALKFPGQPLPYTGLQREADEASVATWAQQSLEWVGTPPHFDSARPVLLFAPRTAEVGGPYGDFVSGETVAQALRQVFPQLWVALHSGGDEPAPAFELMARFPDAPVLLATTGRWNLPDVTRRLADALRGRAALHLALWNPEHVAALGLPAVITHGFRPANLRALATALEQT